MIEKAKNYAEVVKEVNFDRKTKLAEGLPVNPKANVEPSRRDRMMEFAKHIHRPVAKKQSLHPSTHLNNSLTKISQDGSKQIEILENQHLIYQQRLKDLKIN